MFAAPQDLIGQTILHYRILDVIGGGGMGVVYRAQDLRLGREVALKFLPAELAAQGDALERFRREARLASALNHPNICTIHDIGEYAGLQFIVMELLEGKTLRQLIEGQPLEVSRLIAVALQIAEALEAAHRRGIIHRDVKPANVFVTRDGQVKVLDFGLAKFVHERRPPGSPPSSGSSPTASGLPLTDLTTPGVQVGTMAYMSPEQARGEPLDRRSDLFSFGAVIYEMATGTRAFAGDNPVLITDAILNKAPVTPTLLNPILPTSVNRIVEKALERDRDLRYQNAADVIADLRRVKRELDIERSGGAFASESSARDDSLVRVRLQSNPPTPRPLPRPERRRRQLIAGGAAAIATIVAVVLVMWYFKPPPRALTDRDSILLADFANTTGEAVFDDTLRQALAAQLGQSPFLWIVSDEQVGETLQLMGRKPGERLTRNVAREVCERQGTQAMLDGSIASIGTAYVLTLHAANCKTGETIGGETTQVETKEQVLQALGRMASTMRARLGESLATVQKFDVPLEQATTPSLEAWKAYTLGVAQRARGGELESVSFFLRAIELDHDFASAYYALSTVYGNLGEAAKSEEYARLAHERRARVSERERLSIVVQYHDRVTGDQEAAAETLNVWKHAFPRDWSPVNTLALIYNRLGRYERAVEEGREAQRRNPLHPFPYSNLAYAYRGLNRFDEAKKTAEEAVALRIETLPTRRLLYQLALLEGDMAAARRHVEWAGGRAREFDLIGAQAQAAAYSGRIRDARDLYRRTVDMAMTRHLPEVASGYAAQAAWLEQLVGNSAEAARAARAILAQNPSAVPKLRAAGVLALAADANGAEAVLRATETVQPDATLMKAVFLPITHAAIALRRKEPDEAIAALRPTLPYEFGIPAALAPVYLRAEALLLKGAGREATSEYQKILDHRGVDPFSPFHALAHLGLGRASVLAANPAKSRRHYETFFTVWAQADRDVPVLQQARAEYARLRHGTSSGR